MQAPAGSQVTPIYTGHASFRGVFEMIDWQNCAVVNWQAVIERSVCLVKLPLRNEWVSCIVSHSCVSGTRSSEEIDHVHASGKARKSRGCRVDPAPGVFLAALGRDDAKVFIARWITDLGDRLK